MFEGRFTMLSYYTGDVCEVFGREEGWVLRLKFLHAVDRSV